MAKSGTYLGIVFMERENNFYDDAETLPAHTQLPQFLPRRIWPSSDPRGSSATNFHPLIKTNIDWGNRDAKARVVAKFNEIYPLLAPMAPFQNHRKYDGVDWYVHAASMHVLLRDVFRDSKCVNDLEMMALLRTISYGMYSSMTFLKPWTLVGSSQNRRTRNHTTFQEVEIQELGMMMQDGHFQHPDMSREHYTSRMANRRWIVVPIKHGSEEQWGMTIFDRRYGQLYIFDCQEKKDRPKRIEGCLHLWIRFLNWVDMPWSFQYFAPGVTVQTKPEDSGLICAMWVMLNLRNQVGKVINPDTNTDVRKKNYIIHTARSDVKIQPSSLHLHDWVPDGCFDARRGMDAVKSIIRAMICNELGLLNNIHFKREFGPYNARLSPRMLVLEAAKYMEPNEFPFHKFWTAHGGPHFVMAETASIRPWVPGAERAHHPPPDNAEQTFPIAGNASLLTTRPVAINLGWPEGNAYTSDRPLLRYANNIRLNIKKIKHEDKKDTTRTRHVFLKMMNQMAEVSAQNIETDVDLILRGPTVVTQQNNVRVLRFDLDAHVKDDPVVTTQLTFPIDDIEMLDAPAIQ